VEKSEMRKRKETRAEKGGRKRVTKIGRYLVREN
jgi:hypothetical protein